MRASERQLRRLIGEALEALALRFTEGQHPHVGEPLSPQAMRSRG